MVKSSKNFVSFYLMSIEILVTEKEKENEKMEIRLEVGHGSGMGQQWESIGLMAWELTLLSL